MVRRWSIAGASTLLQPHTVAGTGYVIYRALGLKDLLEEIADVAERSRNSQTHPNIFEHYNIEQSDLWMKVGKRVERLWEG